MAVIAPKGDFELKIGLTYEIDNIFAGNFTDDFYVMSSQYPVNFRLKKLVVIEESLI